MSQTSRSRFQAAFAGEPLDRPPVWVMRQAGRYLPEYRELKKQYDFLTLVKTPELATEVTLQPLKRFALDAAIIFSDILIIPEAMGQPYHFKDKGGIGMDFHVRSEADIEKLKPEATREATAYLPAAIRMVKKEIGETKTVLGFGGAPWTLATYMIEGGATTKDFPLTKALFFEQPAIFEKLMNKICQALIELFDSQIEAGVDAIQIFDSWGAGAPGNAYWDCSLKYIEKIISSLKRPVPVIIFAKGMSHHAESLIRTGARFIAADPTVDLPALRSSIPSNIGLQGNLDPILLTTSPELVQRETQKILQSMQPFNRYIFNLGHGITPDARLECMQALVDTITDFPNR